MSHNKGFSILEMLIVLAIMGLLAVILLPAYDHYMLTGNRSDAIRTVLTIQLNEEKHRLNNASYGALTDVWSGTDSIESHYTIAVSSVTASTYTITATATGSQASDTECATFTLSYANGSTTKTATNSDCWSD